MAGLVDLRSVWCVLTLLIGNLHLAIPQASAQQLQDTPSTVAREAPHSPIGEIRREQQPGARESVQADVSARNFAVTSSFNGTEIVIFGAVDNSQQPSAESGYYDVLIVVEGVPERMTIRRKSNVAGLWLNTAGATFDLVPSFYAIASTRPIDEITTEEFRATHGTGFQHLRFAPAFGEAQGLPTEDLMEFRRAIIRLKRKQGLYQQDYFSVAFIGRSLFRATFELPANVTVGPFETRVYLFREEKLLSQYTVRVNLEREGIARSIPAAAYDHPALYGLSALAMTLTAGFIALFAFPRTEL
jgi:uncharacterized protein (TIGR02186 family)